MLAKRLPTILPAMSLEEAIEATKVHSVAGLTRSNGALITRRPSVCAPVRLNLRSPGSSPSTTATEIGQLIDHRQPLVGSEFGRLEIRRAAVRAAEVAAVRWVDVCEDQPRRTGQTTRHHPARVPHGVHNPHIVPLGSIFWPRALSPSEPLPGAQLAEARKWPSAHSSTPKSNLHSCAAGHFAEPLRNRP